MNGRGCRGPKKTFFGLNLTEGQPVGTVLVLEKNLSLRVIEATGQRILILNNHSPWRSVHPALSTSPASIIARCAVRATHQERYLTTSGEQKPMLVKNHHESPMSSPFRVRHGADAHASDCRAKNIKPLWSEKGQTSTTLTVW